MVLEEMILTASELRYVMDDFKDEFSPNFVENSVPVQQLLSDPAENNGGSNSGQMSDPSGDLSQARPPKRKKMKRSSNSTETAGATSSMPVDALPCLEAYPGPFNFQLQLPADSTSHRWTYSKILKKVFIDIDKVLALQFKWNFSEVKNDAEMFVRAMPVYTSDDSLNIPVTRCPIHLLRDNPLNTGFDLVEHVMRCEHSSTTYDKDSMSQRYSCRTPLSRPQPGSDTTTLTYKFVCKTSCIGGMNRKPISVIFTLEDIRATEFGRQKLAVKICSCPKRDKSKEEKNEMEKNESEPRSSISNESAPSVICAVNGGSGGSADSNEHLRDIKRVVDENQRDSPNAHCSTDLRYRPRSSYAMSNKDNIIRAIHILDGKMDEVLGQLRKKEPEHSSFQNLKLFLEKKLAELSSDQKIELQDMIQQSILSSSASEQYPKFFNL